MQAPLQATEEVDGVDVDVVNECTIGFQTETDGEPATKGLYQAALLVALSGVVRSTNEALLPSMVSPGCSRAKPQV